MRKIIVPVLFFLCLSTGYSEELSLPSPCLQEFLSKAEEGDFIVAEAMKMFTLIRVRAVYPKTLVLEEISGQSKNLPNKDNMSWTEWVKNKAPGHRSWSLIEISMEDGQILECYSFSRNAHIQLSQKESLLATLLKCPLREVTPDKRRRVGPPPLEGEGDFRKLWSPPFIFEGKKVDISKFDVFETSWPEDGSELGGRHVTFYFDHTLRIPLPIWIEVETSHSTGSFRVIDSGKSLPSPFRKASKQPLIDQLH